MVPNPRSLLRSQLNTREMYRLYRISRGKLKMFSIRIFSDQKMEIELLDKLDVQKRYTQKGIVVGSLKQSYKYSRQSLWIFQGFLVKLLDSVRKSKLLLKVLKNPFIWR